MSIERLELHYHLLDDSHEMDAIVRNKCEAEVLAAFLQTATELGIPVQIESTAYTEGGLREVWQFLGTSSPQLTLILAVIVVIFSRYPPSDPEIDALNKENAKLTVEEKKLNIEKLKRDISQGVLKKETIGAAVQVIQGDLKVVTRRSNFYRGLIGYDRVTDVGFGIVPAGEVKAPDEQTVPRSDFYRFVLATDKLPVEVIDEAEIEIVSPVLREGNYLWKGIFQKEPVSFAMVDQEFKASVLRKEISFQNGSSIRCVLNLHRKLNELGDAYITSYVVSKVLTISVSLEQVETPQGKKHRHQRKLEASQGRLFENPQ